MGIDVLDAPQLTGLDQLLQLQHGRVIPEQMTHHQDAFAFGGQRDEFLPFLD